MRAAKNGHRNPAAVALLCALVASLPFSLTEIKKLRQNVAGDFDVYLNAAYLTRAHDSADIYDSADTGENPQLRRAAPDSAFARCARQHGIQDVGVYVYPPLLADALLPLAALPLPAALNVWRGLNLACMLLTAVLLTWLFRWPLWSARGALTVGAVLLFRTNISALYWEQVTLLLLLLVTAGLVFYAREWMRASAVCIALAAAIKLTPAILALPLLFWREWRWLRWFAATLLAAFALCCAVNGPAVVADFFLRVIPPMSNGMPGVLDCSLPSAVQMLGAALSGVQVKDNLFIPVSRGLVLCSKALTAVVFLTAMAMLFRRQRPRSALERALLLALVALLGVVLAPVSWRHAYTLAVPALFLLWRKAFAGEYTRGWLVFLAIVTVEGGFILDTLLAKVSHGVVYGAVPLIGPVCFLIFIFHELRSTDAAPSP